jgi:WD40 repeat protein
VWRLTDQTNLLTLKGHEAEIASASFSPDGKRIITGSFDHTAKIWDATGSMDSYLLSQQEQIVPGAAFSPDSARLVTVSWDGTGIVWDTVTGVELVKLDHGANRVWTVGFSPDGGRIVTGSHNGSNGSFSVWDAFTGRELLEVSGHGAEVYSAVFSPDGKRVLTGAADGTARLWDASTGRQLLRFDHSQPFVRAAFSPDGRRIVTVCEDSDRNTLDEAPGIVWDATSGRKLLSLDGHPGGFSVVAFSRDGRRIISGGIDGLAIVWDAFTGRRLLTLRGHRGQVIHLPSSPDPRRIITSGFDGTTRVWDTASGDELLALRDSIALNIAPNGRHHVAGSEPPIRVWKIASPEQVESWRKEEAAAARRLEVALREQATPTVPDRTLGIRKWLVLGPIELEGTNAEAALDQPLIPQEASLLPREGDRVRVGPVERVWTAMDLDDSHIDFQRRLGGTHEFCAAYAVCYVTSETAQSALHLLVGSDDHAMIYLNGQEIYRHVGTRGWKPEQDEVTEITLKTGINVLVLKVINERGPWGGSVRLTDAAGQPVPGIRVTLDPRSGE